MPWWQNWVRVVVLVSVFVAPRFAPPFFCVLFNAVHVSCAFPSSQIGICCTLLCIVSVYFSVYLFSVLACGMQVRLLFTTRGVWGSLALQVQQQQQPGASTEVEGQAQHLPEKSLEAVMLVGRGGRG